MNDRDMNKFLVLLILIVFPSGLGAQKLITLKECYEKSEQINSLAGEKTVYSEISALKAENLSKGWLPTIDANGSFLYNSSVIDMGSALGSIPIPGIADMIKPLPHEQYKVTVDINQMIYDGGAIKNAKAVEKADLAINEKQNETDLYKLRSQINTYYFNILLLDRQKEILQSYLSLLDKRLTSIQSGVNNGVILRTDADILTAERIRLRQQLDENEIRRTALIKILSDMTGITADQELSLAVPSFSDVLPGEITRPELELFDLRKQQLEAGISLINSKRMPKAFGFATLGYGNPPGNNFFKDEFAPYYILGAGIKWNIFDWNKAANEKQVIRLQQGIIENRKTDLSDNLSRMLDVKRSEINSLSTLITTDEELITIRKRITLVAESQYDNGIITATELLNEITAERLALINAELHKVNLALAQVEYLNISGQDIE